ncbi:MAG: thioesterase family protein [Spirochaetales bacterium]|nr:thioesterase family protein [Spirochaetales bacterium]
MEAIHAGLQGEKTLVVGTEHTAGHLGSGGAPVYATPMLVLALEEAALNAVDALLPPGKATVGFSLDVKHLAPTPVGMRVTAKAELVSVNGSRLTFKVEAHDERERIGEGTHVRVIIDLERFSATVASKTAAHE